MCRVEGSGTSGIDDCDRGSMCWDVDRNLDGGTCVAFCRGNASAPSCDDPAKHCEVLDEEVLALCLSSCDPLAGSCHEGEMCCPRATEVGAAFGCVPQVQNLGFSGDPCELPDSCEPGQACVPGGGGYCDAGSKCCAPLCSVVEGEPNPSCPEADMGQICVSWYGPNAAPEGLEHVGICAFGG